MVLAAQLAQLHAQLRVLLPELLQVQHFLESSLALNEQSEVAPLLRQKVLECRTATALLRAPPAAVPQLAEAELQALREARPFVEECVATLRENQALLEALTTPSAMPQQPSLGTTERAWRQHGVVVGPRQPAPTPGPAGQAAAEPTPAPAPAQRLVAAQNLPQQQQQQQQQPAPLGMALLMEQQRQEREQAAMLAAQQAAAREQAAMLAARAAAEREAAARRAMPPPWAVPPAGAPRVAGAPPPPPQQQQQQQQQQQHPSVEALPVLPSIAGLPTLSQLMDEPSAMMMSLSLKDEEWGASVAAAIAAAGTGAGDGVNSLRLSPALTASLRMVPPVPAPVGGGGAAAAAAAGQEGLGEGAGASLGMQLSSVRLLEQLLQPSRAKGGAASEPGGQTGAQAEPLGSQQADGSAPPPLRLPPPHQQAASPFVLPAPAPAGGTPTAAQVAAAQHALLARVSGGGSSAPLSPIGSDAGGAGSSGNLSYRRVSFMPLPAAAPSPAGSAEEGLARAHSAPGMPLLGPAPAPVVAPPAVAAPSALQTPAASDPQAPSPSPSPSPPPTAVPAAARASPAPAAPAGWGAPRVAVVPAGTHVRIAASTAAPQAQQQAGADPRQDLQHRTAATAAGPLSFVSVHEVPMPHDFSRGETSLSHLFYTVKETGTLPPPAEEGGEEDGGGTPNSSGVSPSPASSSQGGASTAARGAAAASHSTGSQQRPQGGSAASSAGLSAGQAEVGGTKRRRSAHVTS